MMHASGRPLFTSGRPLPANICVSFARSVDSRKIVPSAVSTHRNIEKNRLSTLALKTYAPKHQSSVVTIIPEFLLRGTPPHTHIFCSEGPYCASCAHTRRKLILHRDCFSVTPLSYKRCGFLVCRFGFSAGRTSTSCSGRRKIDRKRKGKKKGSKKRSGRKKESSK